jgi:hypothetical protein
MNAELKDYFTDEQETPKKKELRQCKDIVEEIYKEDDKAINSDKRLIYLYGKKLGIEIPSEVLELMPSFASIVRSGRKLRATGEFQATDTVEKGRFNAEQDFKEWSKE